MTGLSDVRPPRRPLADRLRLRLYLGDRLRYRLATDRGGAPGVSVFAACVAADLAATR